MGLQPDKKNKRSYQWVAILYPESADPDWKNILNNYHFSWCCSPLHDKDTNPDGEIKKEHYHLIFKFETLKSYDQVCDICSHIKCTKPQIALSLRGAVRYLTHEDNPEKYHYNQEDIYAYGLDVAELSKLTVTEQHEVIRQIKEYIRNNNILEFADLDDYMEQYHPEWAEVLIERSNFILYISNLLQSRRGCYKSRK